MEYLNAIPILVFINLIHLIIEIVTLIILDKVFIIYKKLKDNDTK